MSKDTHSTRTNIWIGVLATFLAVVVVGFILVIIEQSKQVLQISQSLESLRTDVKTLALKPETPAIFTDLDTFNTAVIGAFEGYVKTQQQEALKAKEAQFMNASITSPEDKHIYGSLQARFTLVEFSDFECGFCKRFHDTPKRIVDESNGMVNWQWKHLPLSFHNPSSAHQAHAAECVAEIGDNRKFWIFVDEVFKNTRGGGQGVADLLAIASAVGVNEDQFLECMQSGRHRDTVEEHVAQAAKFGINGTPATFVVDNHTGKSQLLSGAQPEQAFLSAMRKLVEESNEKTGLSDNP